MSDFWDGLQSSHKKLVAEHDQKERRVAAWKRMVSNEHRRACGCGRPFTVHFFAPDPEAYKSPKRDASCQTTEVGRQLYSTVAQTPQLFPQENKGLEGHPLLPKLQSTGYRGPLLLPDRLKSAPALSSKTPHQKVSLPDIKWHIIEEEEPMEEGGVISSQSSEGSEDLDALMAAMAEDMEEHIPGMTSSGPPRALWSL